MSWNYRVIEDDLSRDTLLKIMGIDEELVFGIAEVYYDAGGEPEAYTVEPVRVVGASVDELRWALERMTEALDKPVLKSSELPGRDQ